jgi:predicted outer membrane repeat protein
MSGTVQAAQTGAQTVASGAAGVFPTSFGYYPAEGSRCITAIYTWPAATLGYNEDLSQLEARGVETTVQSAYVDNSGCGQPVTFLVLGTGQNITVPANTQQIIPLFFTGTPQLMISVPATDVGSTRVYYLNVPGASSSSWNTATGSGSAVYAQGSTTLGQLGPLIQATTQTTVAPAASYVNGTTGPLVLDGFGNLRVDLYSASGRPVAQAGTNGTGNLHSVSVAGTYNANPGAVTSGTTATLQTDSRGAVKAIIESDVLTYSAAANIVPAATATDVFTLTGQGTRITRIRQIILSFDATAATSDVKVSLIKRSTANTGGTSSAVTAVPHDSTNAAALSTVLAYTANPGALGTTVGNIETIFMGADAANENAIFQYGGSTGDQSIVLRSTSEVLAVNLEGAALPAGLVVRCKVKWSEI